MSSITLIQPHYLIETDVKIDKQTIKITASKWFARLSDGSQKLYFVTLYEGRIIQVIDGKTEQELAKATGAIAIISEKKILYYIDSTKLLLELNRSTNVNFTVKEYFTQMAKITNLINYTKSLEGQIGALTKSIKSLEEQSQRGFQKRAIALKNRVTSPSCTLVMMFGIIIAFATAIIGTEVSK
ncbi:MAG: hypothetical protein KR126chlam6_00161 [Candidatus Anoxychlamydiales bacterium]|nr:hypothetical protein [Candidatus Anoxychlamydiales bacterium]